MPFDPFELDEFHNEARQRILDNKDGYGQTKIGDTHFLVTIVCKDEYCSTFGYVPTQTTVQDIKNAIIDDLVDDSIDRSTFCSRKGVLTDNDFNHRAEYYENRFVFPSQKDIAFARKIREFHATWKAAAHV